MKPALYFKWHLARDIKVRMFTTNFVSASQYICDFGYFSGDINWDGNRDATRGWAKK